MKKGLLLVFVLVFLSLAAIYIFIPARLTFSSVVFVSANSAAVHRCLIDESKWAAWWPEASVAASADKDRNVQYKPIAYQIEQASVNTLGVRIRHRATEIKSILQTIKFSNDSTAVQWTCELTTGNNPINKIRQYQSAIVLKKNMDTVLKRMQIFLSKKENIYGFAISRTAFKDSTLVATRSFSTVHPDTETVYQLIKTLRQYVAQQGAQEINYPMLHVADRGEGRFETQVAIPVNKKLKGSGNIYFKRMHISTMLATDVYGGPEKLKKANAALQNYLDDHLYLFSPAISFESLVTDRLAERDTAKWITKIYLPGDGIPTALMLMLYISVV